MEYMAWDVKHLQGRTTELKKLLAKIWISVCSMRPADSTLVHHSACRRDFFYWAKARRIIARMNLTIKLDGNWRTYQLANNAHPLSITGNVIAPSAKVVCACKQTQHNFNDYLSFEFMFCI